MNPVTKQQDTINDSLQKIAEGSSITFIGLILSLLPLLIIRLIIVRKWTENDYGVFSLAFSILTICWVVSTLGLQQGLIRNIAYARGREDYEKIPVYISASIWFSFITSTIIGLLVFLFSENISKYIFHESALVTPLQILAFIIPFTTLINVIVIVYRGFDQVKPTVYFQQILINTLFPAFLIIMIIFDQSFINVFYALAISTVITFILLVYYSIKKIQTLEIFSIKSLKSPFSKELILFSFPLFITSIFAIIIGWADTILLGILRNATDVGLYNAALPLAQIVTFPLTALLLIYLPIFSGLFAKNKSEEIKRSYSILTKWLCYITLPFFFLLFLYPEPIITLSFGPSYTSASFALRILSLGYIVSSLTGPCGMTLIVIGKSRFVMFSWIFAAIISVGLNVTLIPIYGIDGAAFATGISIIIVEIVKSLKLYSISGVQPLSKNLLKPTLLFVIIIIPIYLISKFYLTIDWWMVPLIFILFYVIYLLTILTTKSLDEEDLSMIQLFEKKAKIKLNIIKWVLSKVK